MEEAAAAAAGFRLSRGQTFTRYLIDHLLFAIQYHTLVEGSNELLPDKNGA